jgi:hypothetical protein
MPGFDGTGPMGMGPRTGGGFGSCPPGYPMGIGPVYGIGRGGLPWGGGRGRGFGGGRGRRFARGAWGWPFPAVPYDYPPPMMTPDQERTILQNQVDMLSQQLEAVRARLNEIEAPSGQEAAK